MSSPLQTTISLQNHELNNLLATENVLPVYVGSKEAFVRAHIPGSVNILPAQLVCGMAPAVGKIADESDLGLLFSNLGITKETIIIAYDDEGGGWAGRLIWTLDVINHQHYHFLDGGITAWHADNYPLEQGDITPEKSHYEARIDPSQIVTINDILADLEKNDCAIWDARSAQEHAGSKVLAAKGGRIPGAANLDWLELIDRNNNLKLKPIQSIKEMLESRGLMQQKENAQDQKNQKKIITHCQTHHRSGLSYTVGKILGLDIKAYDGSWSEWGNQSDTPVESDVQ